MPIQIAIILIQRKILKNLVDSSTGKIPNLVNKIEITSNSIKDIKQINADVILTIYNSNSNYKLRAG